METGIKIAETANNFIGKEEIKGNLGFKDDQFEEMMQATGWKKGEAWCAYFAELVWKLVYIHHLGVNLELSKLFSGSTVQTWKNFDKSEWVTSDKPVVGAVVIWQKYKKNVTQWSGHAGVVVEVNNETFLSVEGNTNDDGGREGYMVASKLRKYNFGTKNGLRILGFIHPIE